MKAWVLLAALLAQSVLAQPVLAQPDARPALAPPGYALRAWGPESGAPTDIRAIAQTPDGFLWLGTGNGLYRFDGLSFERIEPVAYERRRSSAILTMAVAADGALWLGRDYGGVSVWRNGRLEDLPRDQQVKGAVQAIAAGPQGDVWIATIGGLGPQLHLFRHGRWSLIAPETGLQDESIDHLLVARDGTLWIAQGASVSRIAAGGSRPALVLRHPAYPATLAQDDEGAIWMTSAKGIERLTGLPMIRPLPSTIPAPGLFQHGGRIVTLEARHHPWLAGITGMAVGRDRVWMITGAGIVDVERARWDAAFADPARPIPHRLHGDHEGIHARRDVYWAANDAEIDAQGHPWFVTNRGLVRVEPEGGAAPAPAPPVAIRSLEADGRVYHGDNLTLPAGTRRVQVDAVALSLIDPARNLYRYRLSRVDRDWVQTDARTIAYTGLAPGRYTLEVMAANADGRWSRQAARVTFAIAPYFWQTWWFAALAMLALAAAAWAALRWRIRAATQAVRQRIEDRLRVHEHIARELHDTLLQGFQGLMLRFQSTLERLPHEHPARLELEATLERADDVLIEGRDKVRALRQAGEPVDLAALLRKVAAARLEDGPAWDLRSKGKARRVCAPVADEIEAIAGEALFNARRHAQADRIVIAITFARDSLHLSVTDDGLGMDRAVLAQGQRPGHFGLIHMRERAAALGARFEIADARPHGTVMTLIIPARIAFREVRWAL